MDRKLFTKVSAAHLAAAGIEGETFKAYASTQENQSEDVFADMTKS